MECTLVKKGFLGFKSPLTVLAKEGSTTNGINMLKLRILLRGLFRGILTP